MLRGSVSARLADKHQKEIDRIPQRPGRPTIGKSKFGKINGILIAFTARLALDEWE